MALTESRLRQIIREEARRMMGEGPRYDDPRDYGTMWDRGPGARHREEMYKDQDRRERGGMGHDEFDPDEEGDDEEYEGDDY